MKVYDDLLKIRFLFFFLFNYFEWYALHVIYHRMFGGKGGFVNEDDNLKGNDLKEKILRERLFFRSRLKKEIGQSSRNPIRRDHRTFPFIFDWPRRVSHCDQGRHF